MPRTQKCRQCGSLFTKPGFALRLFCTMACYTASRASVWITKTCPNCGIEFKVREKQADRWINCSRECSKRRVEKICVDCGEAFSVPRSNAHRYTRCSLGCGTVYVDCKRCGARFRAGRKASRSYCSEACRRPPILATCNACGGEYRTMKCWIALGRRFCSFRCYRSFTGETGLERDVRGILDGMGIAYCQEVQIGRWSVDFFLPSQRLAIEADGAYWHPSPAKDRRRDAKLKALGVTVVRIKESEVADGTAPQHISEAIEGHNLVLSL